MKKKIVNGNARYKILYETSRDAIMTLEPPEWRFTSGNPATVRLFNCKNEKDFTSKGPWQLSPKTQPDNKPSGDKAKAMIMKAMKQGSNFFEWTHKKATGEDFPATVLLTRLEIEKGKPFLQATVRDITEEKKIEKELRESEKQLRDLFDNATDIIQSVDERGNFLFVNKKWVEILGYTENQAKKMNFSQILRKDMIPHCFEIFKGLKLGKSFDNVETVFVTQQGKEIIVEGNINPNFEHKKFIDSRGFFRDITQRKKAEEEIEKFNTFAVDRELKMVELKKEINSLLKKLNQKPKYKIVK